MIEPVHRLLPELDAIVVDFWTGGAYGELRIMRCQSCGFWIHPPTSICPDCLSRDVRTEAASGSATLRSFAVNHLPIHSEVPLPFIVALVELVEQTGLVLHSNLVNCSPEAAQIDMGVRVVFEPHGEVFVPLFEPADPSSARHPD
jgi:uncharacterized OB-fold protein